MAPLLREHGLRLLPPVLLFHTASFAAGAVAAAAAHLPPRAARAAVLATGMQSSGLGLLLALKHFSDKQARWNRLKTHSHAHSTECAGEKKFKRTKHMLAEKAGGGSLRGVSGGDGLRRGGGGGRAAAAGRGRG